MSILHMSPLPSYDRMSTFGGTGRSFLIFQNVLIIILILAKGVQGSTKGRDFIVSFFEKQRSGSDQMKLLVILSEFNTTVHIEGFGISDDIEVTTDEEYIYQMDQDTYYKANLEVKSDMAIRVSSEDDISLFCYNYAKLQGDGYLAIPVSSLSTEYMVVTSSSKGNDPFIGTSLPYTGHARSVFLVLATENDTQVTIDLNMSGSRMGGGCANGTFFDGETQTFTLNENEVIGAYCTDDLTGTIISSDKPVAVLSGNNYEYALSGSADLPGHFVEMLLPKHDLGRNFVLYPPSNVWGNGAVYKIVASEDITSIRTSTGSTFNLNTGEYTEFQVRTGPMYLESDKPVTVIQIGIADASMALIQPTHLYANSYDVCNFDISPSLGKFYLTVTVPTDTVLMMDPDIFPQFIVIEGSPFSMLEVSLDTACLVVSHLDGVPFGAMLNFLGPFGGHHSHPAGFNLTDVADKTTCLPSNDCYDGMPYSCTCTNGYFEYDYTDNSGGCGVAPCHYDSTCNTLVVSMSYTCSCVNETAGAHCEVDIVDNCVGNVCVNGMCEDELGSYSCNCTESGYEGVFCETDIDECTSNPCINGTCNDLVNMYNCTCIPGFEGVNCETDIDECTSNPCVNGTCNNLIDFYNCTCTPGYEGVNCETDIDECASSPCVNGTCYNLIDFYNCTCTPGYEGVNCETDIDECASSPCVNGTCNNLIDFYNCTCTPGYEGVNCETDIDECASSPCVNGTCNNLIDFYNCTCTPGYEGVNCETDIDECASSPCVNGTCNNLIDFYNCTCTPGYEGVNCETEINECVPNQCVNGVCNDLLNMYNCTCDPGYTGLNCDVDIDECASNPCVNGSCNNLVNAYDCTCISGFEGINCETEMDECSSNPCMNGGTCADLLDAFACTCVAGYIGDLCQTDIDECASIPCQNGATCTDYEDFYNCTCEAGYTGTVCEIDINECASSPCVHGNCNDLVNMYNCTCDSGYSGTDCATDIDECGSGPCQNGGTCTDNVNGFTCSCTPGYNGTICSTEIDECDSSPCENGANCTDAIAGYTCDCPTGINGTNCETVYCSANPCENGASCADSTSGFACSCVLGFTGDRCETNIDDCASGPCFNSGTCLDDVNAFSCLCPENYTGILCDLILNCGCPCRVGGNVTDADFLAKLAWIKTFLTLDKEELSQQRRKKVSIPDNRPMSVGIGGGGIAMLAVAFSFFIVMDWVNIAKFLSKRRSPKVVDSKKKLVNNEHTNKDAADASAKLQT